MKKKILGSGRTSNDGTMSIGTPTNVKRNFHAEVDEKGIKGLPPEMQKMFESMTTEEERKNPDNKDKAANVLIWMQREEEKKDQNFIRGDFMHGGSGESTASTDDSSSTRSSSEAESKSKFYITTKELEENRSEDNKTTPQLDNREPAGEINANATSENTETIPTAVENSPEAKSNANVVKESPKEIAKEGEATLRRKATKGGAKGPRVTRNITEEEVYAQINAICNPGQPLDKYDRDIELGSGAAGTVFLALNKETKERVAIKIIDLQKQPKKEMILMELKVNNLLLLYLANDQSRPALIIIFTHVPYVHPSLT